MDTRLKDIARTLNLIRQQAQAYPITHSVAIRPGSKEWDAIFVAEMILEKLESEVRTTLDIVSPNFPKEEVTPTPTTEKDNVQITSAHESYTLSEKG